MGLLKIISSLFHGTEKSSELFEAEIPVGECKIVCVKGLYKSTLVLAY